MRYMLDTNIFNRVLDGKFDLRSISDACGFVCTLIQERELEKTSCVERRNKLKGVFETIRPDNITASMGWGVAGAGWGEGNWAEDNTGNEIFKILNRNGKHKNNLADALIAEAAARNTCGLVTADTNLSESAEEFGIKVRFIEK